MPLDVPYNVLVSRHRVTRRWTLQIYVGTAHSEAAYGQTKRKPGPISDPVDGQAAVWKQTCGSV